VYHLAQLIQSVTEFLESGLTKYFFCRFTHRTS
jgi:hypothetical protein